MKSIFKTLLATVIFSLPYQAYSQITLNIQEQKPPAVYDNIHIQKMASDSLSSSFIIWIKKEVKAHKHAKHTENIYVVSGEGLFKIGDKTMNVKAGDYLFIPKNTVHSVTITSSEPLEILSIQSPEFLGDDRIIIETNK